MSCKRKVPALADQKADTGKRQKTESETVVAIIGTAGRGDDGPRMSRQLFDRMVSAVRTRLQNHPRPIRLVSGGAAWADHVAVQLFLETRRRSSAPPIAAPVAAAVAAVAGAVVANPTTTAAPTTNTSLELKLSGLTLYLPCDFSMERKTAVDTGSRDWRTNPGRMMNLYHRQQTSKIGRSTLDEIAEAAQKFGAVLDTRSKGFHARNTQIATAADRVIALTWSENGDSLKDGGTADTWRKAKALGKMCEHIALKDLTAFGSPAVAV